MGKIFDMKNMLKQFNKKITQLGVLIRRIWRKYSLDEKSKIAQIILAVSTIILVFITFLGIKQSNRYTRQQIELQNRPYLAVVNPAYFIRPIETGQWQYAGYFPIVNYGNKAAYELKIINDKVILIEMSKQRIDELNNVRKDPNKNQTEKDIAYARYVVYRKQAVNMICDYLKNNPKAFHDELVAYFSDVNNFKNKIDPICLDAKGNLDFKVDSRSDIGPYQEPSLLLPYRTESDSPKKIFQIGREIHPNTDMHIKNYEKILLVFFVAQYEGVVTQNQPYSIYYIGYHDEFLSPVRIKKIVDIADYEKTPIEGEKRSIIPLTPFTELKMWSDRTIIK